MPVDVPLGHGEPVEPFVEDDRYPREGLNQIEFHLRWRAEHLLQPLDDRLPALDGRSCFRRSVHAILGEKAADFLEVERRDPRAAHLGDNGHVRFLRSGPIGGLEQGRQAGDRRGAHTGRAQKRPTIDVRSFHLDILPAKEFNPVR